MTAKRWYLVKHKSEKAWTAYNVTKKEIESLKYGYKYKGPYSDFVTCLVNGCEEIKPTGKEL